MGSPVKPAVWRALGIVCSALAFVLSGHTDPQSIGELILAIFGVFAIAQGQVKGHAEVPAAATHPADPVTP